MMDRTVHQAIKGRVKTSPVSHRSRPKANSGNAALTQDELSAALEIARRDRLEQDILDYAARKKATT